jgi:hypothetical protein
MGLPPLQGNDCQAAENEQFHVCKLWEALVEKGFKMFRKSKFIKSVVAISLVLFAIPFFAQPITTTQAQGAVPATLPDFEQFVTVVSDDQPGVVRGVYVPGIFAVSVLQQPVDDPDYISPFDDTITDLEALGYWRIIISPVHHFQNSCLGKKSALFMAMAM